MFNIRRHQYVIFPCTALDISGVSCCIPRNHTGRDRASAHNCEATFDHNRNALDSVPSLSGVESLASQDYLQLQTETAASQSFTLPGVTFSRT
ncbi:hypothetical protein CGMCC3_g4005 [Colletotrichum fructicola]|nr:uncharacterized protein CGMCC3_g4005 [Colletotrichum fructicola]KAE9580252.1 hypothetical protein CGMCC3_g4005 [Colletotrichum fructicola]